MALTLMMTPLAQMVVEQEVVVEVEVLVLMLGRAQGLVVVAGPTQVEAQAHLTLVESQGLPLDMVAMQHCQQEHLQASQGTPKRLQLYTSKLDTNVTPL
jgi:hypothetical protein